MYKLLIVDDEILEIEGLRNSIHWNDLGIELIGCAEDGQNALKMYYLDHPDIIITDIRMPLMDGLELTRKIREDDPTTIIILLSAYDEFKYAQEAIRSGVFDYILKPIDIDPLQDIIKRAIKVKTDRMEKLKETIPLLNDADYKNFRADIYKRFLKLEEELSKTIKRANQTEASQLFEEIWAEFSTKNCSLDFIKRWGGELITLLAKSIVEVGENADILFSKDDPVKRIADIEMKDDLYQYIKNIILETCHYIDTNKSFKNKKIIDAALQLLHDKYGDKNISLNKIAETLFITPNYLSTLFKNEVGQGFSDYLTIYRIEEAKKLLTDLRYKIYDISDTVGYADPHYFSKIFKIVTGMTPKEFRNKIS